MTPLHPMFSYKNTAVQLTRSISCTCVTGIHWIGLSHQAAFQCSCPTLNLTPTNVLQNLLVLWFGTRKLATVFRSVSHGHKRSVWLQSRGDVAGVTVMLFLSSHSLYVHHAVDFIHQHTTNVVQFVQSIVHGVVLLSCSVLVQQCLKHHIILCRPHQRLAG